MPLLDFLKKKKDERALLVDRYRDLLKAEYPEATMTETGPMTFRVRGKGLKEATTFLENLFRQCQGLPEEEQDEIIEHHFASLLSAQHDAKPLTPEQMRERLVPTIKDLQYLEEVGYNTPLVKDHLAADLWIVYAIDEPTRVTTLTPAQFEVLEMRREELLPLAQANLRRILPEIHQHGDGDWFALLADDTYTASILLLDELWDRLALQVPGDLVVAVPNRSVVLVTGSSSAFGIAQIRAKSAEIEQGGSYAISQTLLRRRDNRWTAFS